MEIMISDVRWVSHDVRPSLRTVRVLFVSRASSPSLRVARDQRIWMGGERPLSPPSETNHVCRQSSIVDDDAIDWTRCDDGFMMNSHAKRRLFWFYVPVIHIIYPPWRLPSLVMPLCSLVNSPKSRRQVFVT
jgi:hypothetical protein